MDKVDKIDKVDVDGRPRLSGIPCQPACPKNAAGTSMRADGDGEQAGRDEIDFIDLIDRTARSTLSTSSTLSNPRVNLVNPVNLVQNRPAGSILSTLSKKRRRFRHEGQCP
jgi:hypothetical protein